MGNPSKIDPFSLMHLLAVPGIGSQRIYNLITRFKTPEHVLSASFRDLVQVDGIDKKLAERIKKNNANEFVNTQKSLLENSSAKLVTFWDKDFPKLLKNIPDCPVMLFYKGDLTCLDNLCLGVVGTRFPSGYGKSVTEKLVRELVNAGLVIVSGLARGVDTLSHQITIQTGGQTVAVLGSGIDNIYPSENKKLSEIITQNGVVLSEFAMGAKPDASNFPKRNRIISGLTQATLVVEAGLKSGALITADCALEQGKDVFAVPGQINNPKCAGCHSIIQQGAKLITCSQDILEEFPILAQTSAPKIEPKLNLEEKAIFDVLKDGACHIDYIAQQSGFTTSKSLAILLQMELSGYVSSSGGQNYSLV